MTKIATFALGCFWSPDYYFSHLPGVKKVTVGYTGGKKENPTYHNLGNHSETVKIEFNPKKISYEDLLGHFFSQHNPSFEETRQYRSAIFYHDDEQKKLAQKAIQEYEKNKKVKVITALEKAGKFYPAEEYHQKYYEKNNVKGVCHG